MRRRRVGNNPAIAERDDAVGEPLRQRTFVRHHNNRHSQRGLKLTQQQENLLAVHTVEIARRLVGKENAGPIHQRTSQGAALLFAAREFARAVLAARPKAHTFKRLRHTRSAVAPIHFRKPQRQLHVFFQRHARKQIERLEHHPHGFAPVTCQMLRAKLSEILLPYANAAGSGAIESREHTEEGGLTGAGTAEKGEELASGNRKANAGDGMDDSFAQVVVAANLFGLNVLGCRGLGHHTYCTLRGRAEFLER